LVPEGLIEFIPEMNVLISEINEILSEEVSGDIRTYVVSKLTEVSKNLFEILPNAIAE
jgi:pyrophosphate--fructose-6-phosphate 1-phosphotransferase